MSFERCSKAKTTAKANAEAQRSAEVAEKNKSESDCAVGGHSTELRMPV